MSAKPKLAEKVHRNRTYGIVGICIALLALRIISAQVFALDLPNRLKDFITLSTSIIIESLPFVILGIILSILVQVWLPGDVMKRLLPKWKPARRLVISLLGVLLPVCECGNVPLARGLIAQGFTVPESLTFLIAAPIVNPITIITTYQAFRGDHAILVFRILGGIVIANFIGWLYSRHPKPNQLLTPEFTAFCKQPDPHHHHNRRIKSVEILRREANSIIPAFFVGAFVAGFIQVVVPRQSLLAVGGNPVWSIGAMMVLAFIISICSNVDAFFALAFKSTFTAGSLVSFLVFGPIIDIKMLSLMRTTYNRKVLWQITLLVGLMAALFGLAVNYAF